ncbi:MAG: F0F1 ATP synthase subunit epsilon [Alphaproteobacteria bacterium]
MGEQDSIFVKMLIPQKPFSVKEVLSVEIPAVDGPYLVLPRRAPAMKLLKDGLVTLINVDQNKKEKYFVSSGIAKIRDNACTILTHNVLNVEEVKIDEIKKNLKAYKEKENKETHLDEIDQKKVAFLQMIAGYLAK